MIIGCDLDGTICDNLPLLVDELNRFTGENIAMDDISEYDVTKVYNITREDFIQLMKEKEEKIIKKSPLIPGADKYLKKLAGENHRIHIITARSPVLKEITSAWLNRCQIPYHGLHLLNSHDKVEICQRLAVDVMVEDNYNNAVQLAAAGIRVILFAAPHNQKWRWPGERCVWWRDIYKLLAGI
ncbi:putative HAD superfamily protein [Desulfohalotomaculum tongense]|uniref:5' nucleotidase, NT5C type n=1 Tax=Desulforadius tongensis TaxID=1216062 RepID=UPI00195D5913|nr:hypothetical protein [Desulforadius tongensis]MBM7855330.1 putative HAD superfamily protein [Desulforadius tongensis]